MNNLIRAELLKLRTTRTFWWSVVAALAFVPVSIALAIAKVGTPSGASLRDPSDDRPRFGPRHRRRSGTAR
jgi:hypothetical protein